MKKLMIFALCMASNHLSAMTAGQKLIRMVIGDYAKASQQKPQAGQDYDYELILEKEMGFAHSAVHIQEKCRNGQVEGKILTINTSQLPSINPMAADAKEYGASNKSYYGAVGSEELRAKIASVGTCATADKVCSPAGMCVCTNVTTRIWREALNKK